MRCLVTFLIALMLSMGAPSQAAESTPQLQPQLDLRVGHGGTVRAVAITADGGTVASQADDHFLKIWDSRTGWLRRSIPFEGAARGMVLTPDGEIIAAIAGKTVQRWNAKTGVALPPLSGAEVDLDQLVLAPDGSEVAGSGQSSKIWEWDIRQGTLKNTVNTGPADVRWMAYGGDNLLCSVSYDHTEVGRIGVDLKMLAPEKLQQFHLKSGIVLTTIVPEAPADKAGLRVGDVLYESDGVAFAESAQWYEELEKHPHQTLTLSVLRDGQNLKVPVTLTGAFNGTKRNAVQLWEGAKPMQQSWDIDKADSIAAFALAPDAKTLAIADTQGGDVDYLTLRDIQSGSVKKRFTNPTWAIDQMVFSPDGKSMAGLAGVTIYIWDVATGELRQTIQGANTVLYSMAFSGDSKTLIGGGVEKTVHLWDVASGEQKLLLGRDATVFDMAISPDGQTLAAANGEHAVLLWDTQSGELKRSLLHKALAQGVEYSPDGKMLASSGSEPDIYLWDATTYTLLRTLHNTGGTNHKIAFSPDGTMLASASDDGTIKLWNPQNGTLLRTLQGHAVTAMALAFSPDGTTLLTGMDGTLRIWNPRTGEALRSENGHSAAPENARSIAYAPDGKSYADWAVGSTIRIWDAQTGKVKQTIALTGSNRYYIGCLRFSPDSKSLVAGTYQKIFVWDAQSGALKRTLSGHSGWVWSLCFTRGNDFLATGGEDQIRLWNIGDKWGETGRHLATLHALAPDPSRKELAANSRGLTAEGRAIPAEARGLTADARAITAEGRPIIAEGRTLGNSTKSDYVVTTPEGYYVGSPEADRYVTFRLGNDAFPAESFQARYYRPDLVRQALAGQELPPAGTFHGPLPPLLSFTSPTQTEKISAPTAAVSVEVSDDSKIEEIKFFVNGHPVQAKPITAEGRPITAGGRLITADDRDIPAAHNVMRRLTVLLPMPQDAETIQVQALAIDDDNLQSAHAEVLFTRDKTVAVKGKLLGLCVGISEYQDPRLNLRFADDDAIALKAAFETQHSLYSAVDVVTLTDAQATRDAVKAALNKLIEQATPNDTILIDLSGHGWRSDERTFYFATYEVNRNDVANTALPWSDVVERLALLAQKSKRIIVLVDACHSGSAATNQELVKAGLLANSGITFFSSSQGSELSLELADAQHGAFTLAVLEAINGQAAPGRREKYQFA